MIAIGLSLTHAPWRLPVAAGLLVVIAGAGWCARWFRRRLGGVTGDTLGATQQITELLILLVWAAAWGAVSRG